MDIHVEKFGGASVNSASAVRNVVKLLKATPKCRAVVVSAMGKTTNALERLAKHSFETGKLDEDTLKEVQTYHFQVINELFGDRAEAIREKVNALLKEMKNIIISCETDSYDKFYDAVVSFGEILSTAVITEYLKAESVEHQLVMAFDIIKTDACHRSANVLWEQTQKAIDENVVPYLRNEYMVITQGFIGGVYQQSVRTTLGREGSDYTAAILSYCLRATDCTIWKDVDGLRNADPKIVERTSKIEQLPYAEAIELSYYGATIIHPKTLKPLENGDIPLYVKSFLEPQLPGSKICRCETIKPYVTSFIFKDNQALLSILSKDLSFIAEENLSGIFAVLARNKVKVNLMQNSALSFSICFDDNGELPQLVEELQPYYRVLYNLNLRLVTLRHYSQDDIDEIVRQSVIIMEQRSRTTAQFLIKK
ncbi:MAG: aspartate kinase [Bacteroidales bacterium]|jgi:aspartate kinase|nr:aspartate kinase [Bacteroidales bacterium]